MQSFRINLLGQDTSQLQTTLWVAIDITVKECLTYRIGRLGEIQGEHYAPWYLASVKWQEFCNDTQIPYKASRKTTISLVYYVYYNRIDEATLPIRSIMQFLS